MEGFAWRDDMRVEQTILQLEQVVATRTIEKLEHAIARGQSDVARLHGAVFRGDLDAVIKLVRTIPHERINLQLAGQTLLHTAVLGSVAHDEKDTGFHQGDRSYSFQGSTGSWWQFHRDFCGIPVERVMAKVLIDAGAQRSARNANGQTPWEMVVQSLPLLSVHLYIAWSELHVFTSQTRAFSQDAVR